MALEARLDAQVTTVTLLFGITNLPSYQDHNIQIHYSTVSTMKSVNIIV